MKIRGPRSSRRLRRLRRWFVWIFLLLLLALGLGNLILATSWGTGLFEKQLTKRLSLPCEIGRISWSPWAGGRLQDLVINSPEGEAEVVRLAEIETVLIDPSWLSMLKGEKRFDRVEVRGVTVDLALESLKPLLKRGSRQAPVLVEKVKVQEGEKEAPSQAKLVKKDQGQEEPKVEPVRIQPPRKPKQPVVVPQDDFQGLFVFSGVKVRLYSRAAPQLDVSFDDFSGEIPLWGEERSGQVDFQGLRIGDDGTQEALTLPVKWRNGVLEIEEPELHVLGLHLNVTAALSFRSGLPFGVRLNVPAQQIDFTSLRKNAPPVNVGRFSSENFLQGSLLHPSLVSGSSKTYLKDCVLIDPSDGSQFVFDRGQSTLTFSSSGLYLNDFRLIGEEEAFLGNGFLGASGVGAATIRVIANPQRAEIFEKRITQADPNWILGLSPLFTVDRWHRDLRFDLSSQGFTVDLGKDGGEIPLREVARRIRQGYRPTPIKPVP